MPAKRRRKKKQESFTLAEFVALRHQYQAAMEATDRHLIEYRKSMVKVLSFLRGTSHLTKEDSIEIINELLDDPNRRAPGRLRNTRDDDE